MTKSTCLTNNFLNFILTSFCYFKYLSIEYRFVNIIINKSGDGSLHSHISTLEFKSRFNPRKQK